MSIDNEQEVISFQIRRYVVKHYLFWYTFKYHYIFELGNSNCIEFTNHTLNYVNQRYNTHSKEIVYQPTAQTLKVADLEEVINQCVSKKIINLNASKLDRQIVQKMKLTPENLKLLNDDKIITLAHQRAINFPFRTICCLLTLGILSYKARRYQFNDGVGQMMTNLNNLIRNYYIACLINVGGSVIQNSLILYNSSAPKRKYKMIGRVGIITLSSIVGVTGTFYIFTSFKNNTTLLMPLQLIGAYLLQKLISLLW